MSNFTDMPLDTTLEAGDIVTIKGPGEHDLVVREVTRMKKIGVALVAAFSAGTSELRPREGRTLTRIQRPVPTLPTVEGDYILTMSNGYRCVVSLRDGAWLNGLSQTDDVQWLTTRVHVEGSTLTRVIPTDELKHPEVDIAAANAAFGRLIESPLNDDGLDVDEPIEDFESILRRVLEGEFDL